MRALFFAFWLFLSVFFALPSMAKVPAPTLKRARATFNVLKSSAQKKKVSLSALDLTDKKDKAEFLHYYETITGFPDTAKTSEKIIQSYENALKSVSADMNKKEQTDAYTLVFWGYSSFGNVAFQTALPGDKLDDVYAILKGKNCNDLSETQKQAVVDAVLARLDGRLIYKKEPFIVMTIPEMEQALSVLNRKSERVTLDENDIDEYVFWKKIAMHREDVALAAKFNFDVAGKIKKKERREQAYRMAVVLENFDARQMLHTDLSDAERDFVKKIAQSQFAKYSNVTFVDSLINKEKEKPSKITKKRLNLEKSFYGWDVDKKYDFVKNLIARRFNKKQVDTLVAYFDEDTARVKDREFLKQALIDGKTPEIQSEREFYRGKNLMQIPFSKRVLPLVRSTRRNVVARAVDDYEQTALWKYADARYDNRYPFNNALIRLENHAFLADLVTTKQKKKFIEYYRDLTGFPDLAVVSEKMRRHFAQAVSKTSEDLNSENETDIYTVLFFGFNPANFVNLNAAFPGDVLNNAYVILQGGETLKQQTIANTFKKRLLKNIDRRLIGVVRHESSEPMVSTAMMLLQSKAYWEPLVKDIVSKKGMKNYVLAKYAIQKPSDQTFNFEMFGYVPPKQRDELFDFSKLIEVLFGNEEQGRIVDRKNDWQISLRDQFNKSTFVLLSNVLDVFNRSKDLEPLAARRKKMAADFEKLSVSKQFDIVSSLIKSAAGIDNDSKMFENMEDNELAFENKRKSILVSQPEREFLRKLTQEDIKDIPESMRTDLLPEPADASSDALTNAIESYDRLSDIRYVRVVYGENEPFFNKIVRKQNYSKISSLRSSEEKEAFVAHFKKVTKFPVLKDIADNIKMSFEKSLKKTSRQLNGLFGSKYDVLFWGYDPTCSLGIPASLPPSDLDKGYIVLKGTGNVQKDAVLGGTFLAALAKNVDHRIVTFVQDNLGFPHVRTKAQIEASLAYYDKMADIFLNDEKKKEYAALKENKDYQNQDFSPRRFNVDLAAYLGSYFEKDEMLNFALMLEPMMYNEKIMTPEKFRLNKAQKDLISVLKSSVFASYTNAMALPVFLNQAHTGKLKPKLANRLLLEKEFDSWSVEKQYHLVVNLIKRISNDSDDPLLWPYVTTVTNKWIYEFERGYAHQLGDADLE